MTDPAIRSYRDLRVWQEGMAIAEACYRITRVFPREELYGMTMQIRSGSTKSDLVSPTLAASKR